MSKIFEKAINPVSGQYAVMMNLAMVFLSLLMFWSSLLTPLGLLLLLSAFLMLFGYCQNPPNTATVVILLGNYRGSIKQPGFFWDWPFSKKIRIPLHEQATKVEQQGLYDGSEQQLDVETWIQWEVQDTARYFFEGFSTEQQLVPCVRTAVSQTLKAGTFNPSGKPKTGKLAIYPHNPEVGMLLVEKLNGLLKSSGVLIKSAELTNATRGKEFQKLSFEKKLLQLKMNATGQWILKAPSIAESCMKEMIRLKMVTTETEEEKAALLQKITLQIIKAKHH